MATTLLAARLNRACHVRDSSMLRAGSGREHFDKYQCIADTSLLRDIASELTARIPEGIEVLAGLELGGIPIATALSLESGLPVALVRKVAKKYGNRRLVEGAAVAHRRVLVVEDVITLGTQVIASTLSLRLLGAVVEHAICVLDSEERGREKLEGARIELHALLSRSDLDGAGDSHFSRPEASA
jgi:orotate phosphoribosyltransferase